MKYILKINNKYNNLVYIGLLFFIFSFYSFGNFGFINLFVDRTYIQLILFLIMFFTSTLILIVNKNYLWKLFYNNMFMIFLISIIIMAILIGRLSISWIIVIPFVISIFVMDYYKLKFVIKGIIIISTMFSIFGFFLFIIVNLNQTIIPYLNNGYSSDMQNQVNYLNNYLDLLGFVVKGKEINILGLSIYRVSSFGSEPSLLVYLFLAPALLGLLFKNIYMRMCSFIILLFLLFCVISGTIYLSIILGIVFYFILSTFKIKAGILSFFIIFSVFILYYIISFFDSAQLILNIVDMVIGHHEGIKVSSAIERTATLQTIFIDFLSHPFFPTLEGGTGKGFVLESFLRAGIIGIITSTILFYSIFKNLIKIFYKTNNKLFAALSLGMFIQVFSFSAYGWFGMTGLLMLSIFYKLLIEFIEYRKII